MKTETTKTRTATLCLAIAGLLAGANTLMSCSDSSASSHERNGCNGPNGCGKGETNRCSGPNGCDGHGNGAPADAKVKN